MNAIIRITRPVWANPVVTRDLRVRMRGTRTYWGEAGYLLVLGLICMAGYSSVDAGSGELSGSVDPVLAQARLHTFYNFIFMALAGLITLIAPALTAAAVTSERQSLTLDLLVTTPLSATELLAGKLISSIAYILLLLALSLPASALCVVLGGATLGDVFRIYLILAIDGMLMAAIGLYYSCALRQSLQAIVSTYVVVGILLILSLPFAEYLSYTGRAGAVSPAVSLAMLNPFVAASGNGGTFTLGSHEVPVWIGVLVVAIPLIRILVTSSAFKLGAYGSGVVPSLRRQTLFVTFVGAALLGNWCVASGGTGTSPVDIMVLLFLGFAGAALLLPGLFTPVPPDDAGGAMMRGWYRPRAMFQPEHAGSLPFYHVWLAVMAAGSLLGLHTTGIPFSSPGLWALTVFWISGLGFLMWGIARWAAVRVAGAAAARVLALGVQIVVMAVPLLIISLMSEDWTHAANTLPSSLWVLCPLLHTNSSEAAPYLLWGGALSYALGLLFSPVWRELVMATPKDRRAVNAG